jgi:amidase
MASAEYDRHDALGLAALVRARAVSATELVDEAIARIERGDGRINAVVARTFDAARAAAAAPLPDGPFAGVPFLMKDLLAECAGAPVGCGSRFFRGVVAARDSTLVARYRRAGLIFVGRTNTPELGLLPVTEPEVNGPTRNPWRPELTAGGSSGGSGAAVAAGFVPAAHGSDGGGSLRIPASCCGLFALKPTRGRAPVGPQSSESWSGLAVDHALTRSVRDSAALLDAIAAPDPDGVYQIAPPARPFLDEVGAPPGRLRIALCTRPLLPATVHRDCVAAAEDGAGLLRSLGHEVTEAAPDVDPEGFMRDFLTQFFAETAATVAGAERALGRRARRRDLETETWLSVMIGRRRGAVELLLARDRLQAIGRTMARFHERFDLLLTPTLGRPPLPIGALRARGLLGFAQKIVARCGLGFLLDLPGMIESSSRPVLEFIPFTPLANVTGQPSMSVPLHWNADGLPIGVMFTAVRGDEATLFRLAAQLEQARPWAQRRPPAA